MAGLGPQEKGKGAKLTDFGWILPKSQTLKVAMAGREHYNEAC
jgi:hypothetical protein